jgi:4-carboxymuconolactone decarboxylase
MRLAPLDDLTPRQAELSARIAARRGGTRGPFLVWLRSPELCERVEALGAYCRFESSLPLALRELSLLVAARHLDAQYSWNAHVDKAVDAGIPRDCLERVARGEAPDFPDEGAQALYDFSTELLRTHFVSDSTFARAQQLFGDHGLVDIVGSLGNYCMLALLLNAFQVDLQPGRPAPYPDVRGFAKVTVGPEKRAAARP